MNALTCAALGTGFTFGMTALGAAVVFLSSPQRRAPSARAQRVCLGFAAGVMLAATIWSLLIPAMESAQAQGLAPGLPAAGGIALGTAFLLLLGAWMDRLRQSGRTPAPLRQSSRETALLITAVTLHNIPEGMAVGLSFALAAQTGDPASLLSASSLALGIGIQNLPEGAAISLPLLQEGASRARAFAIGALTAVVEPLFGVFTVFLVSFAQPAMPWLLAFAAGAMLLVSVRELIPSACCADRQNAGTLSVLLGFVVMMLLDVLLG